MENVICPNCGFQFPLDKSRDFCFCLKCGTKIEVPKYEEIQPEVQKVKPTEQPEVKNETPKNEPKSKVDSALEEVEFYYDTSFNKKEYADTENQPTYYLKAQDLLIDLSTEFETDWRIWWEVSKPIDYKCTEFTEECRPYTVNDMYFQRAVDYAPIEQKKELIKLGDEYKERKEKFFKKFDEQAEKRKAEEKERLEKEKAEEQRRLEKEKAEKEKAEKERLEKEKVEKAVKQGATLVYGGKRIGAKGYFFEPTLLTNCTQKMDIIQEETFGPVLPVVEFTEVEDAIAWANDCEYGLTSSVYTQNLDMAFKLMRSLKFGETYINRENFEAMQGFHAGWRKSGIGGADGKHGLEEYLQTHVVYLETQG